MTTGRSIGLKFSPGLNMVEWLRPLSREIVADTELQARAYLALAIVETIPDATGRHIRDCLDGTGAFWVQADGMSVEFGGPFKCSGARCPGLAWKASDSPHPVSCIGEVEDGS